MNVVITGASSGIGLELTKIYKEKGCNVFALCRKATAELESLSVNVIDGVDVTNEGDIYKACELVDCEQVDILLNNAGIFLNETLEKMNVDDISKQFEVNTLGPLKVTMAFLDKLKKGSKLCMVSSRMGSIADNNSGSYYGYRMSKAALNSQAKSFASDLAPKGVSVAILHPGFVQTKMTSHQGDITPEVAAKGLVERIDELSLENSGSFWHSNGEKLPW